MMDVVCIVINQIMCSWGCKLGNEIYCDINGLEWVSFNAPYFSFHSFSST